MRIFYILFLLSPLVSTGQQKMDSKISITFADVTLEVALQMLHEHGIEFTYSDDVIPLEARITHSFNNTEIRQILNTIFYDLAVTYKINGSRVILKKGSVPLVQTIRGTITEFTGLPIQGASVYVPDTQPLKGSTTDDRGHFRIENVPVGRITLLASSIGFESKILQDLLLVSGKEIVLDIKLSESTTPMDELQVTSGVESEQNSMGLISMEGRSFTVEETQRFAGSMGDPARMVSVFSGVTGLSDENNALIVRGNSPRGILWRINGIEVPNPNHFAKEGSSNGIVSVLSPNMLDKSSFLTGAFSAPYGNALSGVMEINLRQGNNERREHSFHAGILGLEFSTEGPVAKKHASYLVNYRYSTLAVLDRLGASLGEVGKYNDYQDLSFNVNFISEKAGDFNLFGIGGKSNEDKRFENGIDNSISDVGITGLKHHLVLGKKTHLDNFISWSGTYIYKERETRGMHMRPLRLVESYSKSYERGSLNLVHKFSNQTIVRTGFIYSHLRYDFFLRDIDPGNAAYEEIFNFREQGSTGVLQYYLSGQTWLSKRLIALYGVHYLNFRLTDDYALEPRATVRWVLSPMELVSINYGKHSRIENLQYYLALDHQAGGGEVQINRELGFTRSSHYGLSYERKAGNSHLKSELYWQQLSDVPIQDDPNGLYATLNEDSGFITDTLLNSGYGKNYGIEISAERQLSGGFYYIANASVYQSKFGSKQNDEMNTAYNGNYIIRALIGREQKITPKSLFGFNIRATLAGGRPYVPIDLNKSVEQGQQVNDWSLAFEKRLPGYFRIDVQCNYRRNKPGYSSEWRIDLQNVTHHRNPVYYFFDATANEIRLKRQVGLVPVISYKVDF